MADLTVQRTHSHQCEHSLSILHTWGNITYSQAAGNKYANILYNMSTFTKTMEWLCAETTHMNNRLWKITASETCLHRSSPFFVALVLINMLILGTWKIGIMLVYKPCITIIISLACVGHHPLLYYGDVTGNTLARYPGSSSGGLWSEIVTKGRMG